MNLKDGLHHALQQRVYGCVASGVTYRRARDSKYFIQCLERSGTLTGHDGCVNSICWNDTGELLLSGSDDCRLNIYIPFQKKLLHSIRTGHRANIFSAKFLPCCNDKKIVSCSGDGVVHYTDTERPDTYGLYSYNCHSGTSYEVITTPGDPNTFMSCGEDGTVRMFDIRTKSKCSKRNCKEDVLIDCGKAVTSFRVNPVVPYQLAIGLEDSTVALFDRRSLTTAGSIHAPCGMTGLISKFKPEALKDRTCRVTSLDYSSNGRELLVSYCADYVYLFDIKGQKQERYTDDEARGNGLIQSADKKNAPMKRLRLRGDWSDTGPNARPESEATSSNESSLMQRMSNLFVRWIEESFRGNQQRRRLRSTQSSDSSTSSSTSSPTSFPSRSTNSSSSDSSGIVEVSGMSRVADVEDDCEEMDQSPTTSVSVIPVMEQNVDNLKGSEKLNVDSKESTSECSKESPLTFSRESPSSALNESPGEDVEMTPVETSMPGSSGLSNEFKALETKKVNKPSSPVSQQELELGKGNCCTSSSNELETGLANSNLATTCVDQCGSGGSGPIGENQRLTPENPEIHKQFEVGSLPEGVADSRGDQPMESSTIDDEISHEQIIVENPQGVAHPRGNSIGKTSASCGEIRECTVEHPQQGVASTRGEVTPSCATSTNSQETESDSSHSLAATRIQRMFRSYKASKDVKRIDEWELCTNGADDVIWIPKMTRVYRGHRNARTMIKEARFWGDQYVISGSDCGRIFIWDKDTAEIIMVLQGDRHVVNCVQPHPYDPVLASSGIDYDIKLWTPTASQPVEVEGLDEIIRTNEQMLEESRDTITVPASFMLRMLASLNHARLGRNQDDSETDSNESE